MADKATQNTARGTARKKAIEACERCRGKRIKCNGLQPCSQCVAKNVRCEFAIAPISALAENEALSEKLDLILTRLEGIEQRLERNNSSNAADTCPSKTPLKPQSLASQPQALGVVKLNQQTGCFEYYGRTSTFQIASALGKRPHQGHAGKVLATKKLKRSQDPSSCHTSTDQILDLDQLATFCDYIVPPYALHSDRRLHVQITDRHLESFFCTIHIFLPMLDQARLNVRYNTLRHAIGDKRLMFATPKDHNRPQFVCLLYATCALGALYEDGHDDSSAWASWYFAEAQSMLGRLLGASNLDLAQAALLLGAYAQHAMKPNLAYNLNGIAARLAYSIGLNVESLHRSSGFNQEEAKRTWAIIYIQEIELSLDAGRPSSIHTADMDMSYPSTKLSATKEPLPDVVGFIAHLADISKIVRQILKLSTIYGKRPILILEERDSLRQQLESWRDRLPSYLSIESDDSVLQRSNDTAASFLRDWKARQQSSLKIHFHLANIILLRNAVSPQDEPGPTAAECPLVAMHRRVCLNAARDMIAHIHESLERAPGLRRWTYYTFYVLQAILVLLPQPEYDPEDEFACARAVEVFEKIKLDASQRCAEVVRQYLEHRTEIRAQRQSQDHVANCLIDIGGQYVPPEVPGRGLAQHRTEIQDPDTDPLQGFHPQGEDIPNNEDSPSWPVVSNNVLQTDMYSALYSIHPADEFHVGHHPYLSSTNSLSNSILNFDNFDWPQLWDC